TAPLEKPAAQPPHRYLCEKAGLSCSRTADTWRRGSASAGERFDRWQGQAKGAFQKGDRYLRSLLVNGAMAVVRQAQIRPDKYPWVTKLLGRMTAKQAAIAIAN